MPKQSRSSQIIRVMTWNTRGEIDVEIIRNIITTNDIDIAAFQELPANEEFVNNLLSQLNTLDENETPEYKIEYTTLSNIGSIPYSGNKAYIVVHRSNITCASRKIPRYEDIAAIMGKDTYTSSGRFSGKSGGYLSQKSEPNKKNLLEHRRPYYLEFRFGSYKINFLNYHAPFEGGIWAKPALELLIATNFEFANIDTSNLGGTEFIIIAGDFNLESSEIKLEPIKNDSESSNNDPPPSWKHIASPKDHFTHVYGNGISNMIYVPAMWTKDNNVQEKFESSGSGTQGSDHPPLIVEIDLRNPPVGQRPTKKK